MKFEKSEIFYMVTAINISWGEFTIEGVFFEQERANNLAAQLTESVDYVDESVSIERLPLKTIAVMMANDHLAGISKALSVRMREV